MTDTVRAHLEAIIERNAPSRPHHNPGDDYRDAVAALDLLDQAEKCSLSFEGQVHLPCRAVYDPLVPDPEPSDAA